MAGVWQLRTDERTTLLDIGMQLAFARVFTFVSSTDGTYTGWWYRRVPMGPGSNTVMIEWLDTARNPMEWKRASNSQEHEWNQDCWVLDRALSDAFCATVELEDEDAWTNFCIMLGRDHIRPHYRGGRQ